MTRTRACKLLSLSLSCALAAAGCGGPEIDPSEDTCLDDPGGEAACDEGLVAMGIVSPVPGYRVTTPYGKPGSWAAGYHTGDDYGAPTGARVVAVTGGSVVEVSYPTSWGSAYGRAVIIQAANGKRYLYAHLSSMSVKAGQRVGAGQRIGAVGATGNVTGPHLHFEMRVSPYRYGQDARRPSWPSGPSGSYAYRQDKKVYASSMRFGKSDSDSVWNLDVGLIHAGFGRPILDAGGPSDDYGQSTRSAVAAYQRSRGWSGADADGIAGRGTVEGLGLVWVP